MIIKIKDYLINTDCIEAISPITISGDDDLYFTIYLKSKSYHQFVFRSKEYEESVIEMKEKINDIFDSICYAIYNGSIKDYDKKFKLKTNDKN